jgi:glycosyltransferase involved in cell wall biosynthesis
LKAAQSVGLAVRAQDRSRSANLYNKGLSQETVDWYLSLSETSVDGDCPTVQHQVADQFFRNRKTKFSVGYSIFEMTGIPSHWIPHCYDVDRIWTGSDYSKDAFLNSGVSVPIHVLPHAIDIDKFSPSAPPWQIENRRNFAFLSVFDFTPRKCWKELLRAYWTAFSSKDDVCLILKVFYSDFSDEARASIMRRIVAYREELKLRNRAPILLYGYDVPDADMPGLYTAADCYVGISREGFGLPYAEAMSCGVACIGPKVGGTRVFQNPDNAFLVQFVGNSAVSPEMLAQNPSFVGLKWADHSWEDLSVIMRTVAERDDLRVQKATAGRDYIVKNLSFESIGKQMSDFLPE